ncbi:MAG: hypothetical protein GY867_00620 [bacterium]|nr:hypothetical protein [bacterium]
MQAQESTTVMRAALAVAILFVVLMATPGLAALEAADATPNSITINWTAPGDDGTSGTASGYDIRYSTSTITDANWISANQASGEPTPQAAGTAESFEITGLTPGTVYYFAIKTADENLNWSLISNIATQSTTTVNTAPDAIADFSAGSPTTGSLTLSWTATGSDGSSGTASQYDIRYSTSTISDANWNSATPITGEPAPSVAGSSESVVVTGLNSSTTYYFAIKAADEVPTWSALSNIASGATITGDTPPATIANLGLSNPTETSLTLSWTAPGADGASGTASAYDIRYYSSAITVGYWDAAEEAVGEPSPQPGGSLETFVLTGLNPGTTYYVAIKTRDIAYNWSGISNSPSATTTLDNTPPLAVTTLNAVLPSLNALTLVWLAPGDDGSSGTASAYDLRFSTSSISEANWGSALQINGEPTPSTAGTPESLTVSGLAEATTYYFALKTADEMPNWSALSNVASNSTAEDTTPPAAIQDLSATTGENNGEIDLVWTTPGDDGVSGSALFYDICFSSDPLNETNWGSAISYSAPPLPLPAGSQQSLTLTSLVPGQNYYIGVKTYDDAANESAISNVPSAAAYFDFALDNDALAQPSYPPVAAVLPTSQPVLTVENATTTGSNEYRFELATDSNFFGSVAGGIAFQEEGATTSWKVSEKLEAEQTYYWRVATNDDGYSETSSFSVAPFTHAYPNPVRLSEIEGATFTDLPNGSNLTLVSVSGSVVKRWAEIDGSDIVWDGTNESGSRVASGTYMWYLSDGGGNGKLLVVR